MGAYSRGKVLISIIFWGGHFFEGGHLFELGAYSNFYGTCWLIDNIGIETNLILLLFVTKDSPHPLAIRHSPPGWFCGLLLEFKPYSVEGFAS